MALVAESVAVVGPVVQLGLVVPAVVQVLELAPEVLVHRVAFRSLDRTSSLVPVAAVGPVAELDPVVPEDLE